MHTAFKTTVQDLLQTHAGRICRCLDLLNDEQVWHDFNEHLVSAGNLVLHLEGNVSQHVLSAFGGQPYTRHRDAEFSGKPAVSRDELKRRITDVVDRATAVIGAAGEKDWHRTYTVQGKTYTGLDGVMHVVEHFAWHTGQITFAAKLLTNTDTGYYRKMDLKQP